LNLGGNANTFVPWDEGIFLLRITTIGKGRVDAEQ